MGGIVEIMTERDIEETEEAGQADEKQQKLVLEGKEGKKKVIFKIGEEKTRKEK